MLITITIIVTVPMNVKITMNVTFAVLFRRFRAQDVPAERQGGCLLEGDAEHVVVVGDIIYRLRHQSSVGFEEYCSLCCRVCRRLLPIRDLRGVAD